MKTLLQRNWVFAGVLLVLFAVLAFFSCSHLTESPPASYDEGVNDQVSLNQALYGRQEIQVAPGEFVGTPSFVSTGYPVILPVSWSLKYFGIGLFQVRIVMVTFIFLMAIAFLILISQLFGLPLASASLALIITFAPLYGDGKTLLGEVPGFFFLACFLISLLYLEKKKYEGVWWYCFAGIFAGLCLATKPIFLLLAGAVVAAVFLHRTSIVFKWKSILCGLIAFCIPIVLWILFEFAHTNGTITIFQVLRFYYDPVGLPNPSAQILPNMLRFFHETSPIYFMLLMVVWAVAYGVRLRKKTSMHLVESIAFIFSLLVWAAFLRTQGDYRYFFPAEIFALAFVPNALWIIIGAVTSKIQILNSSLKKKVIFGVVFACMCASQIYPLLFTSWIAVHTGDTYSQDYTEYFSSQPATTTFFIYNEPAAVLFLGDHTYYQYLVPAPQSEFGVEGLPLLAQGKPDVVIVSGTDWKARASSTFSNYVYWKDLGRFVVLVKHT